MRMTKILKKLQNLDDFSERFGGASAGQRDPEKSSVPGTVVGQGGLEGDGLGVWYLCQIVELSGDVCVKCRHPKSLKSTTCFIF
jgi:hypothetical protein